MQGAFFDVNHPMRLVKADFARDLERKLAEVTEERNKYQEMEQVASAFKEQAQEHAAKLQATEFILLRERDAALAKLAKCREALAKVLPIAVGNFLTSSEAEAIKSARETLEQTLP